MLSALLHPPQPAFWAVTPSMILQPPFWTFSAHLSLPWSFQLSFLLQPFHASLPTPPASSL